MIAAICIAALGVAACGPGQAGTPPLPTEPDQAADGGSDGETDHEPASTATALPTPTPESYYIDGGVPQRLVDSVEPALQEAGLERSPAAEGAVISVVVDPGADAVLTAVWVYALAAPFPTVPDGVSWAAFETYWKRALLDDLPNFGGAPELVLTSDAAALLEARIGSHGESLPLTLVEREQVVERAWGVRPALSVMPFDTLTPRWKVLTVDGQSPLDRTLNVDAYPLTVRVGLVAHGERGEQVAAGIEARGAWLDSNRDPGRITNVVVTGVTALARATAMQIESRGYDFPPAQIAPFFADHDILHTSNEVAFTPQCPPPDWVGEAKFCSAPKYMTLLTNIGLDVVELTGNHINDYGRNALSYSIDRYVENGIAYYGGGKNTEDARQPAILTAPDGTRVAFVGCNVPGPYVAYATEQGAGAAQCEADFATLIQSIQTLKANNEADVVIATLQYWELDQYTPSSEQAADFALLAESGADIVSGSQAHQPQGFAFEDGSFIHYGVGNLFFDQMDFIENRQMFADKHVLYEGRHISTVLFTGLMEDYAQPNPMTAEERAEFLRLIFEASGW